MFLHEKINFEEIESTTTEDGKRFYKTPNGKLYPSVTTITSLHNKDSILKWRKRVGDDVANKISSQAASRGTKVHKICEDYLNNEIDTSKVMPNIAFMFKKIQPFLDRYIGKVYGIECPLYSNHLRVAGRTDCVAEFDGKPAIIDFKTSTRAKDEDKILNYFMQCAAYAVMFEERTGIAIPRIAIVIAVEDDHPQLFVKKRDSYIGTFIKYRELYDTQQRT